MLLHQSSISPEVSRDEPYPESTTTPGPQSSASTGCQEDVPGGGQGGPTLQPSMTE